MKPVTHISPQLWYIDGFLSPETCDQLILWSEQQGYDEAKVQIDGQQVMMKGIRNNSRVLVKDEALASRLWETLRPYLTDGNETLKPIGLNELFRFYRYESGERFKTHRDGSFVRNPNEFSVFTFLIYLNDAFEGGATRFGDKSIAPQTGRAVVFLHELKHSGEHVVSGCKYVLRSDIMYSHTL